MTIMMMIAQSFMTANTMHDTVDYDNNDNLYTNNKSFNYATDILMGMVMITMMGIMMMTTTTTMLTMLMMTPLLVVKKTLPPTILT